MDTMYVFSNVIGSFVFDKKGNVIDSVPFKDINDYLNRSETHNRLKKKYHASEAEGSQLTKILAHFSLSLYDEQLRKMNLMITRSDIKNAVKKDTYIIQAVQAIKETDKAINILGKKVREWYALYNPEFEHEFNHSEKFFEKIVKNDKKTLLKEMSVTVSMGADLEEEDINIILEFAKKVQGLFTFRKENEKYLENVMSEVCPNVQAVAGTLIGAKLIALAGSLEKLVRYPASTLQLLGAETALFRHMRNKKIKPPKYGVLHEHPLIQKARRKDHGKIARAIADKISIAAKLDFFRGTYMGDTLKKGLEEKFS